MARRQNLRRLAKIAERLATDTGLSAAQRQKYAAQIAQLSAALGLPADTHADSHSDSAADADSASTSASDAASQPTVPR